MKEIKKYTFIALSVVILLTAFICVMLANPKTADNQVIVFSDREPTDVMKVEIVNAGGAYTISFDKTEGGYTIEDLPMEYVDVDAFIDYMTVCGTVAAIRKVDSGSTDLASYGLTDPGARVSIEYSDGDKLYMDIGNVEPVSGNYYITTDDGKTVYMYPGDYALQFMKGKTDFLSRYVTSPAIMSSPLSEITNASFSGRKYEVPVSIIATVADPEAKLEALSFGAATHIVKTRGVHQLDQTYGIEVMRSLLGLQALDVIRYNVNASELEEMGFSDPDVVAVFDRVLQDYSVQKTELLLVEDVDNGGYMATVSGTGLVYRIAAPEFADIKVEKLLLRWFLTPMILDLDSIQISDGENELNFEFVHGENNDIHVLMNGKEMNIDAFRKFFSLITSATSADGDYLKDTNVTGKPLLTLSYGYRNAEKAEDVMQLYEGSLRRHNVSVNSIVEFDMAEGWLRTVKEAMQALKSGTDFDINW